MKRRGQVGLSSVNIINIIDGIYSMKRRQVGFSSGRRGSLVPLPGEEGDAHLG